MNKTHTTTRGFTLIEIIVAVAIIALAGAVLSRGLLSIVQSNKRLSTTNEIKQNGGYAQRLLEGAVRSAYDVDSVCDGSVQPFLAIKREDGGSTLFECASDDAGTFIASSSGGIVSRITSTTVSLGIDCDLRPIRFACSTSSSGKRAVSLTFTLYQPDNLVDNPDVLSQNFSMFVTMRN